jgi:hypothetical protein
MKLKTPFELINMVNKIDPANQETLAETLGYIDKLHQTLKNYQIVIDQAVQKNEEVN